MYFLEEEEDIQYSIAPYASNDMSIKHDWLSDSEALPLECGLIPQNFHARNSVFMPNLVV